MGVPTLILVRRIQIRDVRYRGRTSESGVHKSAVLQVWVYPREQSTVETRFRVSEVCVRVERGLQCEQEHCSQTLEETPLGAEVFEWRRTLSVCAEVGNVEPKRRLSRLRRIDSRRGVP